MDGILTTLLQDTSIMELLFSLLQRVRPALQRLLLVQQMPPPIKCCQHKKPEAISQFQRAVVCQPEGCAHGPRRALSILTT